MKLLIITNNPRNASFRQRIELHLPALRDSGLDCEVVRLPRGALARRRLFKQAADFDGSTEFIVRTIAEASAGSKWAVGTEINLVSRLARENPDKLVFCLDPVVCPCSTMYRIHPAYLCWVLEKLVQGQVVNRVQVDTETARYAKIALDRMLAAV